MVIHPSLEAGVSTVYEIEFNAGDVAAMGRVGVTGAEVVQGGVWDGQKFCAGAVERMGRQRSDIDVSDHACGLEAKLATETDQRRDARTFIVSCGFAEQCLGAQTGLCHPAKAASESAARGRNAAMRKTVQPIPNSPAAPSPWLAPASRGNVVA